jgi:hypothetical protein
MFPGQRGIEHVVTKFQPIPKKVVGKAEMCIEDVVNIPVLLIDEEDIVINKKLEYENNIPVIHKDESIECVSSIQVNIESLDNVTIKESVDVGENISENSLEGIEESFNKKLYTSNNKKIINKNKKRRNNWEV